jgi:capsular polysaccharide biosynthesis protein
MDEVDVGAIGDFAAEPIAGVDRRELTKPDHRLPLPPRFVFGPQPANLAAGYYKLCSIGTVGVFVAHGLELSGNYLLSRDGRYFLCPELNVHPAHIAEELRDLRASGMPGNRRYLPGQYALLAGPGHRVYGHWLVEHLPKLGLLHGANYDVRALRYLLPNTVPDYVTAWLDLLGITGEHIVFYDPSSERISCDELLVPTIQHNGCRVSPLLRLSVTYLRRLIEEHHSLGQGPYGERIFLSRAHFGLSRRLLNRERVEEMAKQAGFTIVYPERLPLLDQIKMLAGAKCLMGEYGSALHGSIFSPPGTVVCALRGTLLHPGFIQSGLGEVFQQSTGYVFGMTDTEDAQGAFTINEDALEMCMQLVFGGMPL